MLQWHLQLRLGSLRSGVVLVQGSQILSSFLQTQCKSDRSQCSLSPKRSFVTTAPCYKTGPSKKVGGGTIRENLRKKYRNVMVRKEDLNKRPSDLEIAKKELPENTPTLGERLDRDVYNLFHVHDEKHGYRNKRKQGMSLQQEVDKSSSDTHSLLTLFCLSKTGEAANWAWYKNTPLASFQGELPGDE